MNEGTQDSTLAARRARPWCIAAVVLFAGIVVSWFVWGPFGLTMYIGGLLNLVSTVALVLPLSLVVLLAVAWLLVLTVDTAWRWRRLLGSARLQRLLLATICAVLVSSVALGFAGLVPSPFDMYMKGFTRYARSRTDVTAIQAWLSTLDPNEYIGANVDSGGIPLAPEEHPAAITRLKPIQRPHGVRVSQDNVGALMVRLTWGGGMIGHWGVLVGDKGAESPPAPDMIGYQPLAPGAWIWYDLN